MGGGAGMGMLGAGALALGGSGLLSGFGGGAADPAALGAEAARAEGEHHALPQGGEGQPAASAQETVESAQAGGAAPEFLTQVAEVAAAQDPSITPDDVYAAFQAAGQDGETLLAQSPEEVAQFVIRWKQQHAAG